MIFIFDVSFIPHTFIYLIFYYCYFYYSKIPPIINNIFFFLKDPAPTKISPLPPPDPLPIKSHSRAHPLPPQQWDRLLEVLQKYRWPGNIRELENLAKCCVILGWEEAMGHIERDGDQP